MITSASASLLIDVNASRLLADYSVMLCSLLHPAIWSIDFRQYLNKYCKAWRRPTLAEAKPQLPSALESLTAVFGMGTGVTSLL